MVCGSGAYRRDPRVSVSKVHLQVDDGVGVMLGLFVGSKPPFLCGQRIPPGRLPSALSFGSQDNDQGA